MDKPSFFYPDEATRTECIARTCNDFEYLNDQGECVDCGKGFYVNGDGKGCTHKKCLDSYQILTTTGDCENCANTDEFPDTTGRKCIPMGCTDH